MASARDYFSQGPLHVSYLPGNSDRLVLSFSGVGLDDEAVPRVEAARLAGWEGENHVLFISDASRSWMNGPGVMAATKAAVARLRDQIKPRRVVAMGNSMGGTAAMLYAAEAPVDAVLAIVPQYSVHPEIAPWETRWTHFTAPITDWPYPTAPDLSGLGMQVMILHGSEKLEKQHAKRFARSDDVDHYMVQRGTHTLAFKLKTKGLLEPITSTFIAGDMPSARIAVEAAGGLPVTQYRKLRSAAKAAKQYEARI